MQRDLLLRMLAQDGTGGNAFEYAPFLGIDLAQLAAKQFLAKFFRRPGGHAHGTSRDPMV